MGHIFVIVTLTQVLLFTDHREDYIFRVLDGTQLRTGNDWENREQPECHDRDVTPAESP